MSKNRTFVQAFLKNILWVLHVLQQPLQWVEHGKAIFKTISKKFFHLMSKNYGFVAPFSQKNNRKLFEKIFNNLRLYIFVKL